MLKLAYVEPYYWSLFPMLNITCGLGAIHGWAPPCALLMRLAHPILQVGIGTISQELLRNFQQTPGHCMM
jgi:hypothetical protein